MWHWNYHRKQTNSHWRSGYIGQCPSGWADSFYWDRSADLGQVHSVLFWEKWACIAATWSQQSLRNYKVFFWGHHILRSSLQNPCHPLWFSTDSSRFPHGSFFLLPDHLQDSHLLLHWFYPWRRMAAFSSCSLCSSSVDFWVCSHSNMMHYVCFDCPLVRNCFIHNPVNVTTLTSLEKEEQDLPVPFQ